jgi:hypothetical protein
MSVFMQVSQSPLCSLSSKFFVWVFLAFVEFWFGFLKLESIRPPNLISFQTWWGAILGLLNSYINFSFLSISGVGRGSLDFYRAIGEYYYLPNFESSSP